MYRKISQTWRDMIMNKNLELKAKGMDLRRRRTIERIERPTRIDRARRLGYKAKQGFIVVRVKVSRGGMRRSKASGGRRPKHAGIVKIKADVSMRQTAQNRVADKFPNLKVINSYFLYEDGKHSWYEVILVDPSHPSIKSDRDILLG